MNQIRSTCFILAIACILLLTGCRRKASDEIDFGSFKDSVYWNNYFGLTVTIPPDWSIQDKESRQRIMNMGAKVVAGEDKNLQAVMKASDLQSVHLLVAFKHPIGAPVSYNPNIMVVAERVSHMPGIKRGKDYHFHSKKLLELSQLEVSFLEEITTEQLGGVNFDVMYIEMSLGGMVIKQKQYATVMKGYALLFIVSFTSDEEESTLGNILNSVVF